MKERTEGVRTRDGEMDTFVVRPDEGPCPAVVIYMDIWGVREELRDIARHLAATGYHVLLPDLYYRLGKVANRFGDDKGRMMSFAKLDPEAQKKVLAPMLQLTDAMMLSDTAGLMEFADRDGAAKGPMGCVGYCMGGRHVLCVAGTYPHRFRATACLHGVNLVTDQPDSPHRLAQDAQGELYCGHGEKDPFSNPGVLAALDEAFRGRGFRHHSVVHKGVDHGYALPDRDVYDKHAVNRDWEIIYGMFRRQLRT